MSFTSFGAAGSDWNQADFVSNASAEMSEADLTGLSSIKFIASANDLNYGWNNATNHKGGRAIWQIEDAGLLLLAYEECEDARAREKQLLADYKAENGCYPLANWRG